MADDYWKKILYSKDVDWGGDIWGTGDYPETDWGSAESRTTTSSYAYDTQPYSGPMSAEYWDAQERSFLNQPDPGWEDFELGQGDYAGTWETEEERKALEDDYSWWDSVDDVKQSVLGGISALTKGAKTAAEIGTVFKKLSGAGGQAQRQQRADGVSQRGRMPTQSGGGPTRMTKAQATQSAAARIQAAGGSRRGDYAAAIMRNSNARVNNANNLYDIIKTALSGPGAGGKGQQTIALSSALRQLPVKLPRYLA